MQFLVMLFTALVCWLLSFGVVRWGRSGGPQFSLKKVKIAPNLGGGVYGAMVDVPAAQLFGITAVMVNAELPGDASIVDSHAEIVKGRARLRFGSVSLAVLKVITGRDFAETGTTPTRIVGMKITAKGMPYFAICGKANSTKGGGDTHLFASQCKIVSEFTIGEFQYGQYSVPELTIDIIPDEALVIDGTTEVQTVTITGTPTGGTFKLTFQGAQTAAIAFDAVASAVDTALEALSTIGAGNVIVSGSAGGPYTVTFAGDLANQALPALVLSNNALTGGTTPSVTITETTPGVDGELQMFEIIEHETAVSVVIPPAA